MQEDIVPHEMEIDTSDDDDLVVFEKVDKTHLNLDIDPHDLEGKLEKIQDNLGQMEEDLQEKTIRLYLLHNKLLLSFNTLFAQEVNNFKEQLDTMLATEEFEE
eukprot:TRINITY_DN20573_c0_g1_i1.p1 TRINITY_DN20573_c0_g1~~TRINITY_DN20573_c0_g1_i1.p1  ORF type:complete len:119 (-),score=28.83 TRINITY_DN20573_c0_g1_i1:9-317(-)